ncbi:MAG: hypothetical protein FWC04_06220, partial [Chitinispirillia bacterium]|nr:hypothetical protein [Chitinispirillia bacterium]
MGIRKKSVAVVTGLFLVTAFIIGCGVQLRSKDGVATDTGKTAGKVSSGESQVVYRFFDEKYTPGGFDYIYPDASKMDIPENSGKNGEVSLYFDLEANDFSGGAVCLYNMLYDLSPYYATGALQFWIKGSRGGEIATAGLSDDENTDGKKTVVRLPINKYGGITKDWTLITIPLRDFGK